jgi:DNA-binding GntR family transcriptional regulator
MGQNDSQTSNTARAAQALRTRIFSGALGAGTDHLESELAAELDMSRTPVREALLMLQAQGLVEVRPRKGVRICPVSPADMAEIYDVLTELESLAAADAASQGYTDTDLTVLTASIDHMERGVAEGNRQIWAEGDDLFHSELVRLGGNSRVISIVGMMSDQVRRARLVTLYMRPVPTRSNADHRDVLDAIRTGDADRARRIHRAHRRAAKAVLIELLERHHLKTL